MKRIIKYKRCPYCGRLLEFWNFHESKCSDDGLQSYCKACQKDYKKVHPDKEYKKKSSDKSLSIDWNKIQNEQLNKVVVNVRRAPTALKLEFKEYKENK